jgi:hypothetical protein
MQSPGIEIMMSSTRLYEALKAEALRTNDIELIKRWNRHAAALSAKLDRQAAERKQGVSASAWFYGQSWAAEPAMANGIAVHAAAATFKH